MTDRAAGDRANDRVVPSDMTRHGSHGGAFQAALCVSGDREATKRDCED